MDKIVSFRMPTIEIETKEDLCSFLIENPPKYICEKVEEKNNPIGLQWDYYFTAYIENNQLGTVVVKYKENLFNLPDITKKPISPWLEHIIEDKTIIFKGKIST